MIPYTSKIPKSSEILSSTNWINWNITTKEFLLTAGKLKYISFANFEAYFIEKNIKSDQEERYDRLKAALIAKPVDALYTENNKQIELDDLDTKFHSALVAWSQSKVKERVEWRDGEAECRGWLLSHVDRSIHHPSIKDAETAFTMWTILQTNSCLNSWGIAVSLVKSLDALEWIQNMTLSSFAAQFRSIYDQLASLGIRQNPHFAAIQMLARLPPDVDPIVMSLTQLRKEELTMDAIIARLSIEDSRRLTKSTPTASANQTNTQPSTPTPRTCIKCNKR